ncbi:hypothetical protein K0M31_004411 [Melipona bicolor]|uniref:Uncharacterized protein n=1 Tax=Melipona bicolor TaxID=60889 RepID=A0AA40FWR7_9HYME|nr:hypothetical protein K0M31_004411 [Melipona bicolor]
MKMLLYEKAAFSSNQHFPNISSQNIRQRGSKRSSTWLAISPAKKERLAEQEKEEAEEEEEEDCASATPAQAIRGARDAPLAMHIDTFARAGLVRSRRGWAQGVQVPWGCASTCTDTISKICRIEECIPAILSSARN